MAIPFRRQAGCPHGIGAQVLGRLTDFASSPRGKWVTIATWLVVAGVLLSTLPRLEEVRENEQALFLPRDAEATRAFELASERFPNDGTPTLVVFRQADGLDEAGRAAAAEQCRIPK